MPVSPSPQTYPMQAPHRSSDQQAPPTTPRTSGGEQAACTQPQMAMFSTGLEGEFRACNAAFTGLLGYSPQELLGRDFSTLFVPADRIIGEDQSLLRRAILTVTSSQIDYSCRLVAQPKSGATFPVQFSATLLRDAAAIPIAVIALVVPQAKASVAQAVSPATLVPPGVISRKIDHTLFILASPVMHKFMGLFARVGDHTKTPLIPAKPAP